MRPWQEEVLTIGTLLTDNWDDELLRGNFVDLVLQLAAEQPLKTPFVAAVVLVANANNGELVPMLLKKLASGLEEKLATGAWRDVKLYLKLLACLQSCLEGDGLFPVLEDLFARAAELQTASSEDVSFSTENLLFPETEKNANQPGRLLARSWSRSSSSPYPTSCRQRRLSDGSKRQPS